VIEIAKKPVDTKQTKTIDTSKWIRVIVLHGEPIDLINRLAAIEVHLQPLGKGVRGTVPAVAIQPIEVPYARRQ
jgi:hypothetical protein